MNSTGVESAASGPGGREGGRRARHRGQGVPGAAPRPPHPGDAVPAARSCSSSCSATRRASTSRTCRPWSSGPARSAVAAAAARHVRRRRHRRRTATRAAARERCAAARRSSPSSRPAAGDGTAQVLIDGTELFAAQAALRSLAELRANAAAAPRRAEPARRRRRPRASQVDVLFNPDLRTAVIMIPGLCGIILVFVGTVATALGVVRERQTGTMEQLAVMPFRPRDVFLGKIAPYLLIAAADMVDRRGGRHAAVRRPVPRLRRDVRARRAALPLRHPRDRRAHLERVADPGAGDPAGDDDDAAAVPAERPLLPAVLDAVGGALDRLPPAAHLVHQGRARGDGARRADRRAVAPAARSWR